MLRSTFLEGAPALVLTAAPVDALTTVERRTGGRLGVAALDLRRGARVSYRATERFPLASTFKFPLVATVLARVDDRVERPDRSLPVHASDLVAYAPDVRAAVTAGRRTMHVAELCAAAIEHSDNAAANLLLATCGGPPAVTRFARAHGAAGFRLDRNEPALNDAALPDPRDLTTPEAMVALLAALWRGTLVSPASRTRLLGWMHATTTGDARIRAGVPPGYRVADKTGTTDRAANDVALVHDATHAWAIALYVDAPAASGDVREAAIRDAARIVSARLR